MSKITLNIVEPSSSTPVVPDTGLFTHGVGGTETTIIISAVILLAIVAIILAVCIRKKVQILEIIKSKKRVSAGLAAISLLVSACTFTAFTLTAGKNNTNATTGDLTVSASDADYTIELADEPVFAVLPVEITVEEATEAGYTLSAYAESTDLVSTTNPDNVIPMVTADKETSLGDNTWGLSLSEPTSEDQEVYSSLPSTKEDAITIKTMGEYAPTEANDTTTIYYGFYITPDIPYGVYTGGDINYEVTTNSTLVTFDSNGLYFDNDETKTTNEVTYINIPEEGTTYTINQIISGEYKEPAEDLPYNFLGWSTDKEATVATYTSEQSVAKFLPIAPNQPMTLYAIWQKVTVITYDNNDGTGTMEDQTIVAGQSANLNKNTFTKDGYHFTGWNTEEEGTGDPYEDEGTYTATANVSREVTLYAQWEKDTLYMQDVATWSSSLNTGDEVIAVDRRDDKEYFVARLADGNIWMTQNLDFDIVNGGEDIDHTNTDVPEDWADAGNLTNTYASSSTTWGYNGNIPESYDPGDLYWNGNIDTKYKGTIQNMTVSSPTSAPGGAHYHIGNFYNWTAAAAMSNSSSFTGNANQSICPAGWRLPNITGDVQSFQNLLTHYGWSGSTLSDNKKPWESPIYFPLSGIYLGVVYNIGSSTNYWSNLGASSDKAHSPSANFNGTFSVINNDISRYIGSSVRCVAR